MLTNYEDAWMKVSEIVESLEDDTRLDFLAGQMGYIISAYYKREHHSDALLSVMIKIKYGLDEDYEGTNENIDEE